MSDFGHEPSPKTVCARCGRDLDASGQHVPSWRDEYEAKEAARKAARLASLRPYAGDIAKCQVGVMSNDRAAVYSRCQKRPTVIRDTRDDGAMAVCMTHGKAQSISRYRGEKSVYRGGPIPPADEAV